MRDKARCPRTLAILAGLTLVGASGAALAGSPPEAQLLLRADFGHRQFHAGYGLALGYPDSVAGDASARLVEFAVTDVAAHVRLAGLPLLGRTERVAQNDGQRPGDAAMTTTPWYSRQWVWWTAAGIAATTALAGAGGSGESNEVNVISNTGGPRACSGGGNVGPQDVPETCAGQDASGSVVAVREDETCAVDGFGNPQEVCAPVGTGLLKRAAAALPVARIDASWLDAGTGQMGDLLAR